MAQEVVFTSSRGHLRRNQLSAVVLLLCGTGFAGTSIFRQLQRGRPVERVAVGNFLTEADLDAAMVPLNLKIGIPGWRWIVSGTPVQATTEVQLWPMQATELRFFPEDIKTLPENAQFEKSLAHVLWVELPFGTDDVAIRTAELGDGFAIGVFRAGTQDTSAVRSLAPRYVVRAGQSYQRVNEMLEELGVPASDLSRALGYNRMYVTKAKRSSAKVARIEAPRINEFLRVKVEEGIDLEDLALAMEESKHNLVRLTTELKARVKIKEKVVRWFDPWQRYKVSDRLYSRFVPRKRGYEAALRLIYGDKLRPR